ncbi:MAG: hypothetical protein Q8P02_03065, partial [Candidatus Micrarchaeota archaeon]|nr:hypothetical protein [Candidatus Micrarchaeota archaeon]
YYAGGHVHDRLMTDALGGTLAFTGPLSAADFNDMRELAEKPHGFYVVDIDAKKADFVAVPFGSVAVVSVRAENISAADANERLQAEVAKAEKTDIALLYLRGTLSEGKPSDVDVGLARKTLLKKCQTVYVNNALASAEREAVYVDAEKPDEIAQKVFREMLADRDLPPGLSGDAGAQKAVALLDALKAENLGETRKRFEDVIVETAKRVLNIAP